jgi:hypothetical protein
VCSYVTIRQEGIEDVEGCSEGIEEVEGCSVAFALATKELPERANMILAAHENLMVTDSEESFIVYD